MSSSKAADGTKCPTTRPCSSQRSTGAESPCNWASVALSMVSRDISLWLPANSISGDVGIADRIAVICVWRYYEIALANALVVPVKYDLLYLLKAAFSRLNFDGKNHLLDVGGRIASVLDDVFIVRNYPLDIR